MKRISKEDLNTYSANKDGYNIGLGLIAIADAIHRFIDQEEAITDLVRKLEESKLR